MQAQALEQLQKQVALLQQELDTQHERHRTFCRQTVNSLE